MDDRDLRELQEEIQSLRAELTELKRGRAPRLRGLLARLPSSKPARFALMAAVLTVAAVSYAATISVPYTFVNGTPADADQVNANFDVLVVESNAQDSRITTVENDLGVHEGDASAHHEKTIDFADLTVGQAQDSQVADNITIDQATYAVTAGDANTLDSLDSTAFALSGHNHDDRYYSKAHVDALELRIAALETTFANVSRDGNLLTFGAPGTGMNLQIVDGTNDTGGTVNGLGNLIIGYNENNWSATRTGSHNLVIGIDHEYTSYAGLVAGRQNTIQASFASISGGIRNRITSGATYGSVSGGYGNEASGLYSSVSGGQGNTASGVNSSVSGGSNNEASNYESSVSGGELNTASGGNSSVSGGANNTASGLYSSVSGGHSNHAADSASSVSGGNGVVAADDYDWAATAVHGDDSTSELYTPVLVITGP